VCANTSTAMKTPTLLPRLQWAGIKKAGLVDRPFWFYPVPFN
jgi:hypothetical protein